MPDINQETLITEISRLAPTNRLPIDPFSDMNGPSRFNTTWGATAVHVVDALIEADHADNGPGYIKGNPRHLERTPTPEFNLLQNAITAAAAETRFR